MVDMSKVKILGETTLFGQQSADMFFILQVPKGFKFEELSPEERGQIWEIFKDYVRNDKDALEWAEGCWTLSQDDEFDLEDWLELYVDDDNLEDTFVELKEVE